MFHVYLYIAFHNAHYCKAASQKVTSLLNAYSAMSVPLILFLYCTFCHHTKSGTRPWWKTNLICLWVCVSLTVVWLGWSVVQYCSLCTCRTLLSNCYGQTSLHASVECCLGQQAFCDTHTQWQLSSDVLIKQDVTVKLFTMEKWMCFKGTGTELIYHIIIIRNL